MFKKIFCTWIVLYTDRSELTSRIVRDSATKLLFIGANFVQVLVEFGEKRHVVDLRQGKSRRANAVERSEKRI